MKFRFSLLLIFVIAFVCIYKVTSGRTHEVFQEPMNTAEEDVLSVHPDAKKYILDARELGRKGKYKKAASLYSEAIKIQPNHPNFYVKRAFFIVPFYEREVTVEELRMGLSDLKQAVSLYREFDLLEYEEKILPFLDLYQSQLDEKINKNE